jgi:guanylate kinase
VTVFVTAPVDELDRRLRERATESSGVIDDRLRKAREQLDEAEDFDFVVVNDDRDRAARELEQIVADALDGAATMARP